MSKKDRAIAKTVRIPIELEKEAKEWCERNRYSFNDVAILALYDYMKNVNAWSDSKPKRA